MKIDPGMMWMRHICQDIILDQIKQAKKELKGMGLKNFKVASIFESGQLVGYDINFYDESNFNAYMLMKE